MDRRVWQVTHTHTNTHTHTHTHTHIYIYHQNSYGIFIKYVDALGGMVN